MRRSSRTALIFVAGLTATFVDGGGAGRQEECSSPLELRVGDGATTACLRLVAATPRSTTFVRTTRFGVEDFIAIDDRASDPGVLEYVLSLSDWTRGLRLIGRSLELLDQHGAPRVRMLAPYLVDQRHRVRDVQVAVQGCAIDTDPSPPFSRSENNIPPTPGRDQCTLHLSWNRGDDAATGAALAYPILVDPGWMATGALATPRNRHVSIKLPNGDVLVAGGLVPDPAATEVSTATAEVYSVANGVWAATGAMSYPRAWAAAASLANGDVLITGGFDQTLTNGQAYQDSAEIYSVATGTWSKTTGSLTTPRGGHTAVPLGDGTILVAAGFDNSGDHFENAELFTESTGMFTAAGSMNGTRFDYGSVALPGGRVLIVGGGETVEAASIELYTKGMGWSAATSLPSMSVRRFLPSVVALANGDAVIAGGYNRTDGVLASAEIVHLTANTITITPVANSSTASSLTKARYDHIGVALPDGRALFIGGLSSTGHYADGEIFDPTLAMFTRVRGMAVERANGHQATTLNDGRVLVSGGYDPHTAMGVASTDIFDLNIADGGGAAFLPDDEEREAGPPINPHPNGGGAGDGGVWPPVGDGRPGAHDASTDAAPATTPVDTVDDSATSLTGRGSGCGVTLDTRMMNTAGGPSVLAVLVVALCRRRKSR